jgi:hypothetical protein
MKALGRKIAIVRKQADVNAFPIGLVPTPCRIEPLDRLNLAGEHCVDIDALSFPARK